MAKKIKGGGGLGEELLHKFKEADIWQLVQKAADVGLIDNPIDVIIFFMEELKVKSKRVGLETLHYLREWFEIPVADRPAPPWESW